MLSIEIHHNGQPNLIRGVVYRHPSGNLENFMEYVNSTTELIH